MAHRYSRANDIDNLNDTLVYGSGVNKVKGLGSLVLITFVHFISDSRLYCCDGQGFRMSPSATSASATRANSRSSSTRIRRIVRSRGHARTQRCIRR